MRLVVGLGNPGSRYEQTRHNLGFLVLDRFAESIGAVIDQRKRKTLYGRVDFAGQDLVILKPQTFMNLSGEAVLYLASFLRIPPQDVLVVCDDVSIPFGQIRIRPAGSAGGHNGLKSLIEHMNTDDFPRVRLGVGAPAPHSDDLADFVLGVFSRAEQQALPAFIDRAVAALRMVLEVSVEKAMNEWNGRVAPGD
jgi:PTH1 family peptidyl-tRNA hydrolase